MTTSANKARGSQAERDVARVLGGTRVGMDGGPVDVIVPGYAYLQVKKLLTAPSLSAVGSMIERMPDDGLLRGVVIIHRGGQGVKARRTITFDLGEWARWHGAVR